MRFAGKLFEGKRKNDSPPGQGWRAALTPTVVGAVQVISFAQTRGVMKRW